MPPETEAVDVIVIGGGISGLAAALELSKRRLRVVLLEARPRLGGRIDTQRPPGWPGPVEMGAEFIHVGNPDLWRLMKRAGIRPRKLADRHWLARDGRIRKIPDLDKRLGSVTGLIGPKKAADLSFAEYFARYPARVHPDDWMLARGFVEGFEAAPLDQISARSLAGEAMDDQHQFIVPGGYGQVIARLVDDCASGGVRIMREMVVQSVTWRKGSVSVRARDLISGTMRRFAARASVVSLPLGVLKVRGGTGAVRFYPSLKKLQRVLDGMQMGHVVRISILFRRAAWRSMIPDRLGLFRLGFGFIHSTAKDVPVWWSLSDAPVLVGWTGGPAAGRLLRMAPAARLLRALNSLADVLGVAPGIVRRGMSDWQTTDWTNDPFSRGAYSFTAAGQDDAATALGRSASETLFFAGEATAKGSEVGTVHGALASGLRAARQAARALARGGR